MLPKEILQKYWGHSSFRNSQEEIIEAAITYKLNVISEYQTVLENITLPYTERYRKALLFFCVQIFFYKPDCNGPV